MLINILDTSEIEEKFITELADKVFTVMIDTRFSETFHDSIRTSDTVDGRGVCIVGTEVLLQDLV